MRGGTAGRGLLPIRDLLLEFDGADAEKMNTSNEGNEYFVIIYTISAPVATNIKNLRNNCNKVPAGVVLCNT